MYCVKITTGAPVHSEIFEQFSVQSGTSCQLSQHFGRELLMIISLAEHLSFQMYALEAQNQMSEFLFKYILCKMKGRGLFLKVEKAVSLSSL